jgi:hypothetical protein
MQNSLTEKIFIWVANYLGIVMKLRASDGLNLGTFATGNWFPALAFDGKNIWMAGPNSNTVKKR